ncbi:MAG: hypothetical protein KKC84_04770 [Candidatus Omnitrophica bacterium]|nr:hypothetical protein [Candidatus Omnitrophota bacterium]
MVEKKKTLVSYRYFFAASALFLASVAIVFFLQQSEVRFCRDVFTRLMKGDYSVARYIRWEEFQAMHRDVGKTYNALFSEQQKKRYQRSFIEGFSLGLKRAGVRLKLFGKWRLYSQDEEKVVVAAEVLRYNKILLFTVKRDDPRSLVGMQWQEDS